MTFSIFVMNWFIFLVGILILIFLFFLILKFTDFFNLCIEQVHLFSWYFNFYLQGL